jgi:hypothetical protein
MDTVISSDSTDQSIRAVLTSQQANWNRGDIPAFLEGYWNSPELTFAGSDGVVRGYDGVSIRFSWFVGWPAPVSSQTVASPIAANTASPMNPPNFARILSPRNPGSPGVFVLNQLRAKGPAPIVPRSYGALQPESAKCC